MEPSTPQSAYDQRRSIGSAERNALAKAREFQQKNPELAALIRRIDNIEKMSPPLKAGNGIRIDGGMISLGERPAQNNAQNGGGNDSGLGVVQMIIEENGSLQYYNVAATYVGPV